MLVVLQREIKKINKTFCIIINREINEKSAWNEIRAARNQLSNNCLNIKGSYGKVKDE